MFCCWKGSNRVANHLFKPAYTNYRNSRFEYSEYVKYQQKNYYWEIIFQWHCSDS